jgi:hypothetical protein
MSRSYESDMADTFIGILLGLAGAALSILAFWVIPALFLVSVFITRVVFLAVAGLMKDPLAVSRGAWVLIAGLFWATVGLVSALLLLPTTNEAGIEASRVVTTLTICGVVWGLAAGYKVVQDELAMDAYERASHFTRLSGLPAEFYEPVPLHSGSSNHQELSNEELERRMLSSRDDRQPAVDKE